MTVVNIIGWGACVVLVLVNILLYCKNERDYQRFRKTYLQLTGRDIENLL